MSDRTMLSFVTGQERFNYRVAGVIIRNGHILVCREDDDDYVMLPGGRVEFGEPSDVALVREITEELHCEGRVGNLLFSAENFYRRDDEKFHEIGIYYALQLPKNFPFEIGKPCLVTQDEGHELYFSWIPVQDAALKAVNLHPAWIHPHLEGELLEHCHVVADEGNFVTAQK